MLDKNHIHIQGIKQRLFVRGLFQVPFGSEFSSAVLLQKHGDCYLHVVTYQKRLEQVKPSFRVKSSIVGIDFGIKNQLTLSNSIKINYEVPVANRIRRIARRLSKKKYRSHNFWKLKNKLDKYYDKTNNIKKDILNKLVRILITDFDVVSVQDENYQAWQRIWGSRILNTSIGGITSALLKKAQTLIEVPKFIPTTQECSQCHERNETKLENRIYLCKYCGFSIDRDLNAAMNILNKGLEMRGLQRVPAVRQSEGRELEEGKTPADTDASTINMLEYVNSIPYVKACMVVETGSPYTQRFVVQSQLEKHTIFSRG